MSIRYKTIKELSEMLKNNDISHPELIQETFSLIEENKNLNSFVTLNKENAILKAENINKETFTMSGGTPVALAAFRDPPVE